MKSLEQVKNIQKEIVMQFPDLVKQIGEKGNDEDSLLMITSYAAKMAMVTYILEDRKIPFQAIEEAVLNTMTSALDDLEVVPISSEDSVSEFIKNLLGK